MKMEATKICCVCGDKAIARNFCVFTCESCKAFFRRNASKINDFKCNYGDNCFIDLDTRKRCRKCRLKKCFKVGMKKEWILNESEKKIRNTKIEENRKKKFQKKEGIDLWHKTDNSGTSDDSFYSDISQQSSQQIIDSSNDSNQNSVDFSQELVPVMRPLTDYNNNFTEMEANIFTELMNATKFLTFGFSEITSEINNIKEAMKVVSLKWDEEIRKMVKTVKSMTAFKNICKDDQISLLKYGSTEIAFMRSIICYNMTNENWIVSLDEKNATTLNMQVFKQRSLSNYESCRTCINKLAHIWDFDQIILHLMFAIVLFSPKRPHLVHKWQIRLKQQIYIHLLKRYLLLKYRSEDESESRFSKLMEVINDLHDYHEKEIRQFLMGVPPTYPFFLVSPLMKELYDKSEYNLAQSNYCLTFDELI